MKTNKKCRLLADLYGYKEGDIAEIVQHVFNVKAESEGYLVYVKDRVSESKSNYPMVFYPCNLCQLVTTDYKIGDYVYTIEDGGNCIVHNDYKESVNRGDVIKIDHFSEINDTDNKTATVAISKKGEVIRISQYPHYFRPATAEEIKKYNDANNKLNLINKGEWVYFEYSGGNYGIFRLGERNGLTLGSTEGYQFYLKKMRQD